MHRQGLWRVAALAGGAMLFAHWIAYVASYGDPHARAHVLGETGHGYWLYAAAFGLAAATFGFGALVRHDTSAKPVRSLGVRLARFQVAGFVALELSERWLTGHDVMQFLSEPVLWIGIVVQIAVALIGGSLVRHVARLVTAARAKRNRYATVTLSLPPLSRDVFRFLDPASDPLSRRGPPVLV